MDSGQVNYRLIRDAYRSLNKKKFQEAILVLEKVLSSGAGDIYVLLLLAVAYLHTDQFGKLARFITKMREMNRSYMPFIHLEAFLKLKAAATKEEALAIYIDLMAKFPADAHIHRGRGLISAASDFREFQKNARLQDFVLIPSPPRSLKRTAKKTVYSGVLEKRGIRIMRDVSFPWRRIVLALAGTILVAALILAGVRLFTGPGTMFGTAQRALRRTDYTSVDRVTLGGTEYDLVKNMARDRVAVYYQSVRDVTGDFNRARKLIKEGKHNEALHILNGLYNSNVNFVVKEKVAFLIKFVTDLDEREFSPIPCAEVTANSFRYRGYAVRWKGTVAKIKERGESQILTLRMNVPAGKAACEADVYSGRIVPGLSAGTPVVLEGVIVDFIGKEGRPYIESRSIRIGK